MSLKEWFGKGPKGDWVDIGAPKKGGKFQACGRSSASKSKRAYPKCVPRSKAKSMTAAERKSAVARKRAKPQGVGGKPTNVATMQRKKSVKKKMYMDLLPQGILAVLKNGELVTQLMLKVTLCSMLLPMKLLKMM